MIFRVPIIDAATGATRDRDESARTFAGEPWAGQARYLRFEGADHVWERPPA